MSRADDELAMRQLAASYADAANRRSPEGMAAVYAPDGEILAYHRSGKPIQGRERILKACRRLLEDRSFLFIMNMTGVVEIDGDTARDRWWFAEVKQVQDETRYLYKLGVYQGEAIRLPEGWRYFRRFAKSDIFNMEYEIGGQHGDLPPMLPIALP